MRPLIRWLRGWSTKTEVTAALWAKAAGYSGLFFSIYLVAVPWVAHWLFRLALARPRSTAHARPRSKASMVAGSILGAAGLAGWAATNVDLVRRGRGTALPQEAPKQLVTEGLYRVVRNPMIVSELMLIGGEAFYFESPGVLVYAILMFAGSHLVVRNIEESVLRDRFGESYLLYCQAVPRWLPRLGTLVGREVLLSPVAFGR